MALGYEPCSKIGGHDDYGVGEVHRSAQFIVVTLREVLASFADKVIGVSGRGGLSKVLALENPADVLTG